jgi:integrase
MSSVKYEKTFGAVVREYIASPHFRNLATSTKNSYSRLLEIAVAALDRFDVATLRPKLIQGYLNGFSDRPGQQRCAKVALLALHKWAVVEDFLPPEMMRGVKTLASDGAHEPWSDVHVEVAERVLAYPRPDLARLITLGANTGQRASDLIKMRWGDIETYDGVPGINVRQQKTGKILWIPMTDELEAAIASWPRGTPAAPLVTKRDGEAYTRNQLSVQWYRVRASMPALGEHERLGLSFHGLRSTAVIRLRRKNLREPLIADMVGMSPIMVHRYCRRAEQRENALEAVRTLRKPADVVQFNQNLKNKP